MTNVEQKEMPDIKKPEDNTASEILNGDQFSSQQLEGLTDSDQLDQQLSEENIMQSQPSNPDNVPDVDEGRDDSKGNQAIKEVAENIDKKELEENIKGDKPDQPTENPAPFISQDDA